MRNEYPRAFASVPFSGCCNRTNLWGSIPNFIYSAIVRSIEFATRLRDGIPIVYSSFYLKNHLDSFRGSFCFHTKPSSVKILVVSLFHIFYIWRHFGGRKYGYIFLWWYLSLAKKIPQPDESASKWSNGLLSFRMRWEIL